MGKRKKIRAVEIDKNNKKKENFSYTSDNKVNRKKKTRKAMSKKVMRENEKGKRIRIILIRKKFSNFH